MLRRGVRLGVAAGLLGAALSVVVFLVAPRGGHAVTCTDSWITGNGDWMTPANWSNNAVPNSGDAVCITNNGTFTVTLSSNTAVQVGSLTVGGGTGAQTLVIGSGMTFEGSIVIASSGVLTLGDAGNADTRLTCAGTCTNSISNAGTLQTVKGGGGTRNIEDDITNGASGTIDYGATESTESGGFCGNVTRGITNQGTVKVELTAHFTFACGSFFNQGGTVAVAGGFAVGGGGGSTFVQRGGTVSGQGVVLSNGGVLDDDTAAAAGIFAFMGGSNPSTGNPNRLTGHGSSPGVAPNQTVTVLSGASIQVDNVSNAGTIVEGSAGAGDSLLECYGGCLSTLTNTTGTVQTINGGSGARNIGGVNIVNQAGGTLDFAGNTVQGGGLCGNPGRGITNYGTATIEAVGQLTFQCGAFSNLGGLLTNRGIFTVSASRFVQRAGTESGNAVVLTNGSVLDDDTTAGAGMFTSAAFAINGNPNTLTGTGNSPGIAAGQTVTVASGAFLHIPSLTNAGTLILGDTNSGDSTLYCAGGCHPTLTNTGTLQTVQGSGGVRHLQVFLTNAPTGTLDFAAATTYQDGGCGGGVITNNGTVTVEAVATFGVYCGFTNLGGSVANHGSFYVSAVTFTERGGSTSGNPIVITNGGTLDDDTTAGAGNFNLAPVPVNGNLQQLIGTGTSPGIAIGQTVTIASGSFVSSSSITNAGTLIMGDTNSGDNTLGCAGGCHPSLTNTGTFQTVQGGGGARHIQVLMTNAAGGVIDIAAADTRQDGGCGGGVITNNGTVTVENTATFTVACGFANLGGTVTNRGAMNVNAVTFTQRAGSETVNPVVISNGGTLDDDTTAAAGLFTVVGGSNTSNGNPNRITGTGGSPGIAAAQTVTIASNGSVTIDSITNAGTLLLGDSGGGDSTLGCAGGCHPTLTNTGTLRTVQGGSGTRHIQVFLTNAPGGVMDFAALSTAEDGGCGGGGLTNNGTLTLEVDVTFTEGCSFAQGSSGTFMTTINAGTGAFGKMSGGVPVTINGRLKVTTVGVPVPNSTWPIISGAGSFGGKFASWDLRSVNYWRHYLPTGLTLVANGTCNTFTGEVDSQFGTNNNWSFGLVPDQTEDACITATTTTVPPTATDSYTVLDSANPIVRTLTLGGPSGTQTLTIPSSFTFNIEADSAIGPHGVLVIGSGAPGASALGCQGIPCTPNHPVISNAGTINTVLGDGSIRHIQQVLVTNLAGGTFDVAGNTSLTGGCRPPGGLANTQGLYNSGTVTVEAGGVLQALCGLTNNETIVNHGTLQMGGDVFVQRGTESGNPVIFAGGSGLDPDTTSGPGSFLFMENGGIRATGSHPGIAAADTVTIASTNTSVGVFPPITNAGTIVFGDNSGTGDSTICCEYFTGPTDITNIGLIKTVQGNGGIRHFQQNITNAAGGTIDIAADTRQDPNCGPNSVNAIRLINNGTFTIETSGHYTVGSCPTGSQYQDTFTQSVDGTLQTTINVNTMAIGQLSGGVLSLNGVLRVSTIGSPILGSQWPIITGATLTGQFAVHDFGGIHYAWKYSGTGLTLMMMGLNPCAQMGNGWGCNPAISPPPPSPGAWRIRH